MAAWLPLPISDRRCAITQGPAELDPGVLGVAFLGMLRVLVAERPVLVSVDDLQWLDPPERSFLEFAARRLRREPVVLLPARRLPVPERAALVARGVLAGEVWRRVWSAERRRRQRDPTGRRRGCRVMARELATVQAVGTDGSVTWPIMVDSDRSRCSALVHNPTSGAALPP
jgi:hypothetical protein